MTLKTIVRATVFETPTLVFTLASATEANPCSERVVRNFSGDPAFEPVVFETVAQIQEAFANGHDPERAVAVFDQGLGKKHFKPIYSGRDGVSIPGWACGSKWGVAVSNSALAAKGAITDCIAQSRARNCAEQVSADFARHFALRLDAGNFPWGSKRKGEAPPTRVQLPEFTESIVDKLNEGPDMVTGMPSEHRDKIPRWAALQLDSGSPRAC